MPPGCSVSDIPGNRASDRAEEALWDALYEAGNKAGLDTESDAFEQFGASVLEMLGKAWGDGYVNGASEANLIQELSP